MGRTACTEPQCLYKCALNLFFFTSVQNVCFSFKQLDRFDVDVIEKPFLVRLCELSNFVRNHLHLKVPMEVGVSDKPRCINSSPQYSRVSFYDCITFSNICF